MSRPRPLRVWLACSLVAAALAAPAAALSENRAPHPAAAAAGGWAIAVAGGAVGLFLKGRAVGADANRFLRLGVLAEAGRLIVLVAALGAVRLAWPPAFEPLALAAVAGFFVFIAGEIWYMARAIA